MHTKKSNLKIHYIVRRVHIGTSQQLRELSHECGELYSKALVFFWRTVRHKGIWLSPKLLMRLFTSPKLHAHTSDACVQAFAAALASWRELRRTDPNAKPPHRRRWYFRIEYKRSALSLKEGTLRLSNGGGNAPLLLSWPWDLPQTVVIRWTGDQYEALATYALCAPLMSGEEEEEPDYQAHQQPDRHAEERRRAEAGDWRRSLDPSELDVGSTNNQKLHQWSFGRVRHSLTYKGERAGMRVILQEERDTSRTCPVCGHRRKSKPRGRVFRCTNTQCRWSGHRDAVGAMNIRYKYRGEFGSPHVVGGMAPPTGCGYVPQLLCSSGATAV